MKIDSDHLKDLLTVYRINVGKVVDIEDFKEDVRRFFYIARLLRRYKNYKTLNVRLLLNHTQILYNVFGNLTTSVLISYIEPDLHEHLFGVLFFLYRLPKDKHHLINQEIVELIKKETNVSS